MSAAFPPRRYPDRQYDEGFIGGSELFEGDTYLNFDSRTAFFRFASSSPALIWWLTWLARLKIPGNLQKTLMEFPQRRTHLQNAFAPGIPAANFWARNAL